MTVNVNCILLDSENASINVLTRHPEIYVITDNQAEKSKEPDTLETTIEKLGIDFLNKTLEMLDQFIKYPQKFLKKLQHINKVRGKKKQSRILAIAKVCKFLIRYLELWTLQVGTHTNTGAFVSLCDIKHIAKHTGLAYISVRRAIKDLALAGYLSVKKQVIEKEDGSYLGIASIKQFSTSFFTDLKQRYEKLVKVREWKRKRLDKRLMKALKKKGASFISGIAKVFNKKKSNRRSFETTSAAADALVYKRKEHASQVLKLHKEQPHLSFEEITARLAYMLE